MERKGMAAFVSPPEHDGSRENIASNITQLIGWTPLVELKRVAEKDEVDVRLVAKLEYYQPLSSIKDRSALRMIEDAEEKGLITPGITTLVEATSGNLGIALAYIAAQKGYKFMAVVPDKASLERLIVLKCLGADIRLTDSKLGMQGAIDKMDWLKANIPNVHVLNQLSNPANPEAHFVSTGPEIWYDTAGKVDIFVCASGSGGTLSGTGRYLKSKNPCVKIICVEPAESPVISGGTQGPHGIQGTAPGIIPDNLDTSLIDEVVTVSTEEAMAHARRLAAEEGVLAGISSGANLAASLKVARRAENRGKMIVTIFPSGGERYLSTQLFSQQELQHHRPREAREMERRGIPAFVSFPPEEDGGRENIASDITQLIGWTPLVELKRVVEKEGVDVRLVAKLETYQPLSSVKDRTALRMIEDAEEKGLIMPGITTLVEPTSGNLGIALAYIAARKGYKFIAVMPDHYSLERRIILKCLGADIELTDTKLGIQGLIEKRDWLKENIPNVHVLDQFSNPANPEAHFMGTGPEIWNDTAGKIDIFICASGSGGTLSGAGRYFRSKKTSLKVICVEPAESPIISVGTSGPHDIQGTGPGFIPDNLDTSLIDEVVTVSTEEAMTHARRLAVEEGLLVGISSGANLAACLKINMRNR
ncbi:hypothetical protein Taro_011857, partial [Colocasia esculenta]|nr:hypothetical protein [Colocasia esculenta]